MAKITAAYEAVEEEGDGGGKAPKGGGGKGGGGGGDDAAGVAGFARSAGRVRDRHTQLRCRRSAEQSSDSACGCSGVSPTSVPAPSSHLASPASLHALPALGGDKVKGAPRQTRAESRTAIKAAVFQLASNMHSGRVPNWLPAIFFSFSKRECEEYARGVYKGEKRAPGLCFTTAEEQEVIDTVGAVGGADWPLCRCSWLSSCVVGGMRHAHACTFYWASHLPGTPTSPAAGV